MYWYNYNPINPLHPWWFHGDTSTLGYFHNGKIHDCHGKTQDFLWENMGNIGKIHNFHGKTWENSRFSMGMFNWNVFVSQRLLIGAAHLPSFTHDVETYTNQWTFQDPKTEVLYHIRLHFVGVFPYMRRPYIW